MFWNSRRFLEFYQDLDHQVRNEHQLIQLVNRTVRIFTTYKHLVQSDASDGISHNCKQTVQNFKLNFLQYFKGCVYYLFCLALYPYFSRLKIKFNLSHKKRKWKNESQFPLQLLPRSRESGSHILKIAVLLVAFPYKKQQ